MRISLERDGGRDERPVYRQIADQIQAEISEARLEVGARLKEGLSLICYFSLAAGFLTGKYRSKADLGQSPRGGGVGKYLDEKGLRILAALDKVAASTGAASAEIALAWINAQPGSCMCRQSRKRQPGASRMASGKPRVFASRWSMAGAKSRTPGESMSVPPQRRA